MADVVGAEDAKLEVAAMNSLTVNLHMLMAAFYRPSAGRGAILIEAGAFPSDRIAVVTQVSPNPSPSPSPIPSPTSNPSPSPSPNPNPNPNPSPNPHPHPIPHRSCATTASTPRPSSSR